MVDPIITKLPSTTKAVENKYGSNPDLFGNVPTPVSTALYNLDLTRAAKGQNPLSLRQTQLALQAATTGQAATKPPDKSIYQGFVSDLKNLTSEIPHIPATLINEARQLPDAPQQIEAAINSGDMSGIFRVPGVRLLPGSFILGNLDNPHQLTQHPLFTALDLLPLKELSPVENATSKLAEQIRPFTDPVITSIRRTRPGQAIADTFGTTARDTSELYNQANTKLANEFVGEKPTTDPLINTARQANFIRKQFPTITDDRTVELTKMMEVDDPALKSLHPDELAFVNKSREIVDNFKDYAVSQGFLNVVDGEVYTAKTAAELLGARRKATIARDFADTRAAIETPVDDPAILSNKLLTTLDREDITHTAKIKLMRGMALGLNTAGLDATDLLSTLREAVSKKLPIDELRTRVESNIANLAPDVTRPVGDLIESLNAHSKSDPMVIRLVDALKSERWKDAQRLAKRLSTRTKFTIPDIDHVVDRAAEGASRDRWINASKYTEKSALKAERSYNTLINAKPPARFDPLLQRELESRLITKFSDNPDFDTILPYLREHNYGFLKKEGLLSDAEYRALENDIKSSWRDLKDAGYDPVFVHRLAPGQISSVQYPQVFDHIPRPTSSVDRTWDMSPYVQDISVAMSHQALEFLARRGSEQFIQEVVGKWAQPEQDLLEQYLPAARHYAEAHPGVNVLGHAQQLLSKDFEKFHPEGFITWTSPRLRQWSGADDLYIPKSVANTIQRYYTPPAGKLTAVLDPVMKVFRTSLLPLSPRWHMYNIIGGGVVATATSGPLVWTKLRQAYEMVKAGDIPEGIPHGMGTVPSEVMDWNHTANLTDKLTASYHYAGGQTLRRILDSTQSVRDGAGKLIQKSYDWNGFVDGMYRTMSYLYGHDKALTKGLSEDTAHAAGLELARNTLQDWDRMTPVERNVIRYAFPFYGWMSYMLKYAFTYPVDHPLRTAILGSLARAEVADMGDAMSPDKFMNMFFIGGMDKSGNRRAINLRGMNPFSDVSNYFTLAGLLGQTNPIISSTLEAVGLNPGAGGPDLYPTLTYDPGTGRLTTQQSNPASTFLHNIIPQTQVFNELLGKSVEFKALLRTDPAAAQRLLTSQVGLPIIFRDVNVPQEIAKEEVARDTAQSTALSQSLKSGNWSEAEKYPNLRPVLDKLKQVINTGGPSVTQFSPTANPVTPGMNNIALAQRALLGSITP